MFSTFNVTCISWPLFFFNTVQELKKKLWSKATKSIQLLIISNVITAKFSSYGTTRHGSWESVTNNFGTCVFLRTAVILNSPTPIDGTYKFQFPFIFYDVRENSQKLLKLGKKIKGYNLSTDFDEKLLWWRSRLIVDHFCFLFLFFCTNNLFAT